MVERVRRDKPKKKKSVEEFTKEVDRLRDMVNRDLDSLMFNVDLRDREVNAFIIGILYKDGFTHIIRPEPLISLRIIEIMKGQVKKDIEKL